MGMVIKRFDVYLVNLGIDVQSDIQKVRPCLIISPDEMNDNIATVLIAPMTSLKRDYPTRVLCMFQGKDTQIVLDQMRSVNKTRLVKRLGQVSLSTQKTVLAVLSELFAQ